MFILDDFSAEAHVQRKLAALQEQHPQAEIVYGRPSFDYERQVDMILNKVREYDKVALLSVADEGELAWLNALAPGDVGMVHELRGGRGFVSRLAALGFTTGAEVRMLQNFGHGPLIVSIRDTRIALGRKEASKVRVTHRSAGS